MKIACVPGSLGNRGWVEIGKNPRAVIDFLIAPGRCRLDCCFQCIQNSRLRYSFNILTSWKSVFSQPIAETCLESGFISDKPRLHALNHQINISARISWHMRGLKFGAKMLCWRIGGNSSVRVDQQRGSKVRSVFAHGAGEIANRFNSGAAGRDFHRLQSRV